MLRSMKTKNKKRAAHSDNGLVDAAAKAAQELGLAAIAFKESWDHVQRARRRGTPVTRAVSHTGRRIAKAAKQAVKSATRRRNT